MEHQYQVCFNKRTGSNLFNNDKLLLTIQKIKAYVIVTKPKIKQKMLMVVSYMRLFIVHIKQK